MSERGIKSLNNLHNVDVVKVMLIKDKDNSYRAKKIKDPKSAVSLAKEFLANEDREVLIAINLDSDSKINSIHVVSIGSLNSSIVHPREIFKAAILSNAWGIILAHNHPSGNPEPSEDDLGITRKLLECGNLLGIKIMDHIIIGDDKYTSFSKVEGNKFSWQSQRFEDNQKGNPE